MKVIKYNDTCGIMSVRYQRTYSRMPLQTFTVESTARLSSWCFTDLYRLLNKTENFRESLSSFFLINIMANFTFFCKLEKKNELKDLNVLVKSVEVRVARTHGREDGTTIGWPRYTIILSKSQERDADVSETL